MEGPYRDLGAGFARLAGTEGLRRTPVSLRSVEDALFELLRNARDAGASNIYVASILKARRYRHLTVIDDGHGIPASHAHLVFGPGVTTRHLSPVLEHTGNSGAPSAAPHGAGLSLHHIKQAAVSAELLSASSPTAVRAVFDTRNGLPEKRLQSASKPSRSNFLAVISRFSRTTKNTPRTSPNLYHGSPAGILAHLLHDHIIQLEWSTSSELREKAGSLGIEVSLRTAQRVLSGGVPGADSVDASPAGVTGAGRSRRGSGEVGAGGPILTLGDEELEELSVVLRRVARASYLDLSGLAAEGRPGEIVIKARVYEPEEEYEDD